MAEAAAGAAPRATGGALVLALAAASVGFHLWLVLAGLVPALVARPLHMALLLPFALVVGAGAPRSGAALAAVGVAVCLWIAWNQRALVEQYGWLTPGQVWIAAALLAVVLETARRLIGWPLPLVAGAALAYGLLGQHVPGRFGHSGLPPQGFLGTLVITEGGLWGPLTGVSAGVVAVFVILGAVLNAGEAGQGFMNVAAAAAGRLRGGAAKVSVLASALFGSISGSASANVASTGAVTMPTMIRLGYPRRLAAAVEAVASSGGQIMPPLMGAGAFVMVELTGVPYAGIMAAATLPALLYFWAVWAGIDAFAARHALPGLPASERPTGRDVAITSAFFAVPFGVLLAGIFAQGVTPQYAASQAILAAAALLAFGRTGWIGGRAFAERLGLAVLTAARQIALIGSIILCAAIVVGVLGITGLGVKVTSLILSASGGSLVPALMLTALACLILGMEVPTTAAYVICVSVAGPALIELGLAPLQAHLFVFWYALLSTITPPVCGAVFIAAGMAETRWTRVAGTAMTLGLGLYVVPLGMIAAPAILDPLGAPWGAAVGGARLAAGLGLLAWGAVRMQHGGGLARWGGAAAGPAGLALALWPAG
jgi:TRAP transporter 4TM/12TM fusion protein